MKKYLLAFLLLIFTTIAAGEAQIGFNNRIVARFGNKTISLLDVVKRMDAVVMRHSPEQMDNTQAMFQFYQSQWRSFLNEMIEDQYILHAAEGKDFINVSDGDVREEIQNRYGPNVMATLTRMGLTYEDARDIVHSELVVRQMSWFKCYSKAVSEVTPEVIKQAFTAYSEAHPPKEEWTYQMLSVRGEDATLCEQIAAKAGEILAANSEQSLTELAKTLESEAPEGAVKISASSDYTVENKDLAQAHRKVLSSLPLKTFSTPVAEKSRRDNSTVCRIFHLKDHQVATPLQFADMADQLKDHLLNKVVDKYKEEYIAQLKKESGINDEVIFRDTPSDYQPFTMTGG